MNVAIIPARGGSKRIPRKNIRNFDGEPVIAYSIRAALDSACFDRLLVSTDDEEIAAIAREYGAETPFVRPDELSNDHAHVGGVIRHAAGWLIEQGTHPDYVCGIFATAPFLTARILREGLERLKSAPDKHYAIGVTSFPFPIQRAVRITGKGGIEPIQPEYMAKRSQDLEEAYHDAGQFFWGRTEAVLKGISIFTPHSIPVLLPRYQVQDLDTLEDWERAEWLHRALTLAEDHARRVSS